MLLMTDIDFFRLFCGQRQFFWTCVDFIRGHRAVLAGRPYVGLVYFDLDCICGSPWPLIMAWPSVDYVINRITNVSMSN